MRAVYGHLYATCRYNTTSINRAVVLRKTETAKCHTVVTISFTLSLFVGVGKSSLFNRLRGSKYRDDDLPKTTRESIVHVHIWCHITCQQTCKTVQKVFICRHTYLPLLDWSADKKSHNFRGKNYDLILYDMPGDPAVSKSLVNTTSRTSQAMLR